MGERLKKEKIHDRNIITINKTYIYKRNVHLIKIKINITQKLRNVHVVFIDINSQYLQMLHNIKHK